MHITDPDFCRCERAGAAIADRLWRFFRDGTLAHWVNDLNSVRFRYKPGPFEDFVYHDYIVSVALFEATASDPFKRDRFVRQVAAGMGVPAHLLT